MSKNKYLITLWVGWYDRNDCILQKFSIEHEATNLKDANSKLDKIARAKVNQGLKEFENFAVMGTPANKKPIFVDLNKDNKVVRKECRRIGDGREHDSIYYDFDLIQVPIGTKVDENLFNLKNCEQVVKNFFKDGYKQPRKDSSPEKGFIGVKELAKSKLRINLSSWLQK